jgi:hypothetical protein
LDVVEYSSQELIRLLALLSEAKEPLLLQKAHKRFFEGYLAELNARTIVVEREYIDRDYLQDYSGYYVSCFHPYRRTTARLHFFSSSFNREAFDRLLDGDAEALNVGTLQDSYLGFIVVKPLSQTVIGRTCLKTYPPDHDRRHFPLAQEYSANLAGIDLKVHSLPFQEQDSVAAACATSALWSCFHVSGRQFHHAILSPTEITKAAAISLPTTEVPETRVFPNRGLSPTQMANAINAVGLEPQILGAKDEHLIKSTTYAYLRCKVPVLLGIALLDFDATAIPPLVGLGKHAVATAGYSTGAGAPKPYGATGFRLYASRIDKFYVHDDQLGPFARMSFKTITIGTNPPKQVMSTEWKIQGGRPEVIAIPTIMVLPLYRKIRIPFEVIHDAVLELDGMMETVRAQFFAAVERPEWDIYLTTVTEFKREVLQTANGALGKGSRSVLETPMPKFMWRVTGRSNGTTCCDLLFDATGIEQSPLLLLARIYSTDLFTMLTALAATGGPGNYQARHILESFTPGAQPIKPLVFAPVSNVPSQE